MYILAINPGSTSTKIGLFQDELPLWTENIIHSKQELSAFVSIIDQFPYRHELLEQTLIKRNVTAGQLDIIVGRGGTLRPVPSGVYRINQRMLDDLSSGIYGEHASALGAPLAKKLAEGLNIEAFIADPPVVDELDNLARISGLYGYQRKSRFHALNQKAVARRAAEEMGKSYEQSNFIVAHLGGGITVGAHKRGKVIDVNDGLDGEGPFSPERSGTIPAWALVEMCFSGLSKEDVFQRLVGHGGLYSYFGTADCRLLSAKIDEGDDNVKLIYEAMAYQVAKEIGSMATALFGKVDCIILTGGLAYDQKLVAWIQERVSFICPIKIYPGEDELEALAAAARRAVCGQQTILEY